MSNQDATSTVEQQQFQRLEEIRAEVEKTALIGALEPIEGLTLYAENPGFLSQLPRLFSSYSHYRPPGTSSLPLSPSPARLRGLAQARGGFGTGKGVQGLQAVAILPGGTIGGVSAGSLSEATGGASDHADGRGVIVWVVYRGVAAARLAALGSAIREVVVGGGHNALDTGVVSGGVPLPGEACMTLAS